MPHSGCPCRCSFCDQHSITGAQKLPDAATVMAAVQNAGKGLREAPGNLQLAFFGGSFTAIPVADMVALLEAGRQAVDQYRLGGIRISTRPDCVDEDCLQLLKSYGVTAVELGAQSLCDRVLSANDRGHTAADVQLAAVRVRQAGMELGLQMMTGLYQDDEQTALETAEGLIALKPTTVRIYPALVLKGTRLAALMKAGVYTPQSLPEAVALCAKLLSRFESAGVRAIRVGLHAAADLEESILAGPYHPAFRALCESRRFLDRIFDALAKRAEIQYNIKINPRWVSIAVGHKRCNVTALEAAGWKVRFVEADTVAPGQFEIVAKDERKTCC